jgi:hypothetical protein
LMYIDVHVSWDLPMLWWYLIYFFWNIHQWKQ